MTTTPTDPRRIAVWQAMADHFLDTETRQDIPLTALRCAEAGCTTREARDIWCYEVSPAVAFNVWLVAGEWLAWDPDWLLARIERLRRRWDHCPGTLRWLRYRARVHFMHGVWVAIERCMEALSAVDGGAAREQRARDLAFLACHAFDFCPEPTSGLDGRTLARLRALHPEPIRHILVPALVPGEAERLEARIRDALRAGRRR
jgi:hypothetical protein